MPYLGMGIVWVFSNTGALTGIFKRILVPKWGLNRHFKKRSTKRRLTTTTLKTSSALFPVKAVLMAALTKNRYKTVALVATR